MFGEKQGDRLPADLVADNATAQAHARALRPTLGPSAAPATVTAQIHGQGLSSGSSSTKTSRRRPRARGGTGPRARRHPAAFRDGPKAAGRGNAAARARWASVAPAGGLRVLVLDHVPEEWIEAA